MVGNTKRDHTRAASLDHPLVEVIRSQPVTQKTRGMTGKYVLRLGFYTTFVGGARSPGGRAARPRAQGRGREGSRAAGVSLTAQAPRRGRASPHAGIRSLF